MLQLNDQNVVPFLLNVEYVLVDNNDTKFMQ